MTKLGTGEARKPFRKKATVPVHPRDRYWYSVGWKHGKDGRRKTPKFPLAVPNHGGASYYERYRDMYEAGFIAARRYKDAH